MRATELFDLAQRLPPGDQAGYVAMRLEEVLENSPVSIWRRGDLIPHADRWTHVGIAPYSLPDLELLDALLDALRQISSRAELVQVFDVLACTEMNDLNDFIPGIGKVYQTPAIGVWTSGVLIEKVSGAAARKLIKSRYGFAR